MEKHNASKLNTLACMPTKRGWALSEEEKMIAMEVAARIQARIRSGALAKGENQVSIKEQNKVDKTSDEKPSSKPDEASEEEKKPPA